jgi:tetratricopeptide (TPR) repeat protein
MTPHDPFLDTQPTEPTNPWGMQRAADQGMQLPPPGFSAGSRVGNYVIDALIAVGGMGYVFAARDPKLDRRVAIKVLRPELLDAHIRERSLLSEAKVMARLSHPNVCTVYEVGTLEGRVFLVMEYVDGETLTMWLAREQRRWREVVAIMLAAGRGLEAAHRAGIIHRDFKPENIMIGRDGRVRVMDFGLAGQLREPAIAGGPRGQLDIDSIEEQHSVFGNLIGTPGYMAPEQIRLQPIDERADQFAYCTTFYQALYGARPYPGDNLRELLQSFEQRRLHVPTKSRVPRWLRRRLERGLSVQASQRHPSVGALVAAIERVPRSQRFWLAGAAAIGLLGAGTGLAMYVQDGSLMAQAPCEGAAERMAEVWNPGRRGRIGQAFEGSSLPYAAAQWQYVTGILDRYAADWVAMRQDTCEATMVRREQSEDMLDRRMACLDDRWRELDALLAFLSEPDRAAVQQSAQAAHGLGSIDRCAARTALLSAQAEPAAPELRQRLAELRQRLAEVAVRTDAGKYQETLATAEQLVEEARAAAFAPVLAQALLSLGVLRGQLGDIQGSEQSLVESATVAEEGGDDLRKAEALIELVYFVGFEKGAPEQARQWATLAAASLRRGGGDPELEARLAFHEGAMLYGAGEYADAYAAEKRAVELGQRVFGSDHPLVIQMLASIGATAVKLGQIDEATAYLDRALEVAQRVFGAEHPEVGDLYNNLGNASASQGRVDEARRAYLRAKEIWTASLGEHHANVAVALSNLGQLAIDEGSYDQAIALYEQALAIEEKTLGDRHANLAVTLTNLGVIHLSNDEPARALPPLERAYGIVGDADSVDAAMTRYMLARALWELDQHERALGLARSARAALAKAGEPSAGELAELDTWLAEIE